MIMRKQLFNVSGKQLIKRLAILLLICLAVAGSTIAFIFTQSVEDEREFEEGQVVQETANWGMTIWRSSAPTLNELREKEKPVVISDVASIKVRGGTSSGEVGKIGYVAATTGPFTTTSTSFVDVPDMTLTITFDYAGHILIWFSAEAYNTEGRIDFRILVDGSIAPINIFFFGRDPYSQYWIRTAHGVLLNLAAGTHTIKVQWKVSAGTGYVYYRLLSALVLYA